MTIHACMQIYSFIFKMTVNCSIKMQSQFRWWFMDGLGPVAILQTWGDFYSTNNKVAKN